MERAARRPWSRAVYQSCSGRREPSAQVTLAQSPAAQMSGALVFRASSTSMAPPFERVRAEPARKAVLGTTPMAATTRSPGTSSPPTSPTAQGPEVVETGTRGARPGRGPAAGPDRQEQLVVAQARRALEEQGVAGGLDGGHPQADPLEAHPVVELAIVGLGIAERGLAREDVHEGRPGEEVVVLVGDEGDAGVRLALPQEERRFHPADPVAQDRVVHGYRPPTLPSRGLLLLDHPEEV